MTDLIVQGPSPEQGWRRPLNEGESATLGRECGPWSTRWDRHVSKEHVTVRLIDGELEVQRLPTGRNPVFYKGRDTAQFVLRPGEHFVIGDTRFTLAENEAPPAVAAEPAVQERAFSSHFLRTIRFSDAEKRMEILMRLPDVVSGAADEGEFYERLVNMLLAGVTRASVAAVCLVEGADSDLPRMQVLHFDHRLARAGDFQPSRRLVNEAMRRRQTILHVWKDNQPRSLNFTMADNQDWAFATPVQGPGCDQLVVYLSGQSSRPGGGSEMRSMEEDLRFTEILTTMWASLRQLSRLQKQQATMSQFFPPAVMQALQNQGSEEVLAPREADVSVLFCDLRGFTEKAEQDADNLMGLLQRVSKALGVMTRAILDHGGVVGDFHGDAAMGFWGWPLMQQDTVHPACMAAISIRQAFEAAARRPDHPLAGFRVGIGVATGRAVAGGIGTSDQVKVTVFGPVVNLASRLEGMTKLLHAPILLDETTASVVRRALPPDMARCRTVAKVVPQGMRAPVMVTELLPRLTGADDLSEQDLESYELALERFLASDWDEAYKLLHKVSPNDRVKDYLLRHLISSGRTPPPNWDGAIRMTSKQ